MIANECAAICTKEQYSVVPNIDNRIDAYFRK